MISLNFPRDNFNQSSTFAFVVTGATGRDIPKTGYLLAEKTGEIYIMSKSACIKGSYTEADIAERARLHAQAPVRHGDTVTVSDKQYRVRILGNYSDAGRLDPI